MVKFFNLINNKLKKKSQYKGNNQNDPYPLGLTCLMNN